MLQVVATAVLAQQAKNNDLCWDNLRSIMDNWVGYEGTN
jgi:hypothetical protein